jgi:branched-chain amino acid transport system ATP-binding protein
MPDGELEVRNLEGWYGESHVLHGVDLAVRGGELVTLLGRNGAGKTTILRAIIGLLERRRGSITFAGRETIRLEPRDIARLGIAYCPEERGIFASLTVRPGGLSREDVLAIFPNLRERLQGQGTKLSGGEQQMLAIGRILRTGARFLLLDEPTEGLAPVIVHEIARTIGRLKKAGFTIILVEQNFHFAATVADRHYVIEQGRVVDTINNSELPQNVAKLKAYLGI